MNSSSDLFVGLAISYLPRLIVYTVGLVLALKWYRRHPHASTLAVLACGLGILTAIVLPVAQVVLIRGEVNQVMIQVFFGGASLLSLVGLALLLAAVFVDRNPPPPVEPAPPPLPGSQRLP